MNIGVLFDRRLSFNLPIDLFANKASSVLVFIKRWSKELDDPCFAKRLYMS